MLRCVNAAMRIAFDEAYRKLEFTTTVLDEGETSMTKKAMDKVIEDSLVYGAGVMMDGKRIPPKEIHKTLYDTINEMVAKCLGWKEKVITMEDRYSTGADSTWRGWINPVGVHHTKLPRYATDIKAAWEIVDAGLVDGVIRIDRHRWQAQHCGKQANTDGNPIAHLPSLAICLAVVKVR